MSVLTNKRVEYEPKPKDPVQAFDDEHGPDGLLHESRIYFPSGAWREAYGRYPGMAQPSNDPVSRWKMIHFYWDKRKQQSEFAFTKLKRRLQRVDHPTDADLDQLKEARLAVVHAREQYQHSWQQLQDAKADPQAQQWQNIIDEYEPLLIDAIEAREQSDPDDHERIEHLDNVIGRLESKVRPALSNLARLGYGMEMEPQTKYLWDEIQDRRRERDDKERQRVAAIAKMDI